MRRTAQFVALLFGFATLACRPAPQGTAVPVTPSSVAAPASPVAPALGTAEQRARLFAEIWDKTARREAFSPVKNERLALDVQAAMRAFEPELLAADDDVELFYALVKISNARKDRHLKVRPVPGGLVVPGWEGRREAPLRFAADFGGGERGAFVADLDANFFASGAFSRVPARGDRVVTVNGQPLAAWAAAVEPYYHYSTVDNFWWHFADGLHVRSGQLPPAAYREPVVYGLVAADGTPYEVALPYLPPAEISWAGPTGPRYPDMRLEYATGTYELYRHTRGRAVVLLRWFGFKDSLVADVDRLMQYAAQERLLGHALIVDATDSRGGARGVYALQRMTGRPFTTTGGDLRLSDVVEPFVAEKRAEAAGGGARDGETPETDDGGARLIAWLEGPVMQALRAGREYSEVVPFKLAHLPAESDRVAQPADVHFTGPLVCFFGPRGGSHLDQFAAMVVDNGLGHTIGMPTGGYSNTWEWSEVLTMPGTGRPLVEFMWSIGHTIRPNGEILEGNPAEPAERLPPTAENYQSYHALLLERAYAHLDALARAPRGTHGRKDRR